MAGGDWLTSRDCDTGRYNVVPLFGQNIPSEVAAGTATDPGSNRPTVYGFFQDDTALWVTSLDADGATWTSPQLVRIGLHSGLRVACSPGGRLVIYGSTQEGNLVIAHQQQSDGLFTAVVYDIGGGLPGGGLVNGNYRLCLTETRWALMAMLSAKPVVFVGDLNSKTCAANSVVWTFKQPPGRVVFAWPRMQGDALNALMFLTVDANKALYLWGLKTSEPPVGQPFGFHEPILTVSQTIATAKNNVMSAAGHTDSTGCLHIYTVDEDLGLWVLHQDPTTPWNNDGTANWSRPICLDTAVGALVTDARPAHGPSLFVVDGGDSTLRLYAQDPLTGMWSSGQTQAEMQAKPQAYETVRYRTEINLSDDNGISVPPGYPLTVSLAKGSSATQVEVGGKLYHLSPTTEIEVTTDPLGKLTVSALANAGLSAPTLVINAKDMLVPESVAMAGAIHTYLSGRSTLNPTNPGGALKVFDADGSVLAGATVNGQPLAPAVQQDRELAAAIAQAIRHTALLGLTEPAANVTGGYALDLSGRSLGLTGRSQPLFYTFQTNEELVLTQAKMDDALAPFAPQLTDGMGAIWDEIGPLAGDLWESIKNGASKIVQVVVDASHRIATFALQVGGMILRGVQLAIQGFEQAAHFVAGIFQAVEVGIHKVIDWLKAVFDFKAIWRTKMAFQEALLKDAAFHGAGH